MAKPILAAICHVACVALSIAIGTKVAMAVSSAGAALSITGALLGGWLGADFVGAVYHWNMDNYARGPNGFLDHHREPTALARHSLLHNVRNLAAPVAVLLAGAATLPGGPPTAFLLALLNGVLYSELAHSRSHGSAAEVCHVVRWLQRVPGLPIFISPAAHDRHHAWPAGKRAYGGLNGWSNLITDATHFFRGLEWVRESLTGRAPAWRRSDGRAPGAPGW